MQTPDILRKPLQPILEEYSDTTRIKKVLRNNEIRYLGQLAVLRDQDLLRMINFSKKSLTGLKWIIEAEGVQIGEFHQYIEHLGYHKNPHTNCYHPDDNLLSPEEIERRVDDMIEGIKQEQSRALGKEQAPTMADTLAQQILNAPAFEELLGTCSADFAKSILESNPEIIHSAVKQISTTAKSRLGKLTKN